MAPFDVQVLASLSLTVVWHYSTSGFWLLETASEYLTPSTGRGGGKTLISGLQAQSHSKSNLLCAVSSQHKLCLVCWGRFDTSVLVWQSEMQIRFVLLKWPVSHRLLQWPWHPSISSSVERAGWALCVTQQEDQVGFVGKNPHKMKGFLFILTWVLSPAQKCEIFIYTFFSLWYKNPTLQYYA